MYDDLQRVTSIISATSGLASGFTYAQTGELLQLALNTGGKTAWVTNTYEEGTKRLTRSMLTRQSTTDVPRPTSDIDQHYGYDDAGNVLSIADTPATGERDIQCFAHDYLRRMTQAWSTATTAEDPCAGGPETGGVGGPAPYAQSFTFDTAGNRLTEQSLVSGVTTGEVERTYTYPDAGQDRPHALTSMVETASTGERLSSYTYDAAGNTTGREIVDQEQALTWDAAGHLDSATRAGETTGFVYSADGDRLLRRESGATTVYLPGMELRLDTATGAVATTHYYPISDTAMIVRTSGGVQFQIADRHGTGQAAVDATTGELAYRRSTPFGSPRGVQPDAGLWKGEKGFVGGTQDVSTGLTHLGAREYDPDTGRFISVDPVLDVTDPQQMNAYGYSNNSPVSFSDPSGLKLCSDDSCGMGADYVDLAGNYHEVPGHNDGCGGCSGAVDPTVNTTQTKMRKIRGENNRAKQVVTEVAIELGKILMDELGITDALDCFTTGNLGACAATAVTVISSLIGGIAGKLIAKYGARWAKLGRLIDRLKNLGSKLIDAVGDWMKGRKALKQAEAAVESCATANSFVPGTLVVMADGSTRPIEEVEAGDTVLATDPETGQSAPKTVVATIVGNGDRNLVQVTVDTDGSAGWAMGRLVRPRGRGLGRATGSSWPPMGIRSGWLISRRG